MLKDFGGIPRRVPDRVPVPLFGEAPSRAVERLALEQLGESELDLVRRAGFAAFSLLKQRWHEGQSVSVFCGKGNNAADGYILAAAAARAGWQAEALCLEPPPQTDPGMTAYEDAKTTGVALIRVDEKTDSSSNISGEVIVDALLGTGLKGAPRPPYAQQIDLINNANRPVLALDLPSGLNATTAEVAGAVVRASATISFITLKPGLVTGSGVDYVGHLYLDDLGIPARLLDSQPDSLLWLGASGCAPLPARRPAAHKGDNGRVLLLGGAPGFGGAIILSAEMAVRAGAGLVSVGTDEAHCGPLLARVPEVLAKPYHGRQDLLPLLAWADVIACGPGLGQSSPEFDSESLLAVALDVDCPLVLDADALNLLATLPAFQDRLRARAAPSYLTPHPGEAARLLDCSVSEVEADRATAALTIAKKHKALVALKGAGTLLASETKLLGICAHGNPSLATAGTGDVLSGLLPALIAQGLAPESALAKAVCLHALAADRLIAEAGGIGLAASDLIPEIRALLNFPPDLPSGLPSDL